jgi:peptide/nickel transport system ATP-binding protein
VSVRLQDVTKKFRSSGRLVTALDRVTLDLPAGQNVAVVGESGSGKTTLARLLVGLDQATSGEVLIDDRPVRKPAHVTGRVQMVFQDPFASFNPRHTIGYSISKALAIQLGCSAATARQRSVEALEEVGLYRGTDFMQRMPGELSGGQRQRASIARALGGGASLIVADEPTSMLDVSVAGQTLRLFERLASQGVSYLFITHNLAVARYIADRVVVLYRGVVVEDGPVEDIVGNPQHPYTKLLLNSTPDPARRRRVSEPSVEGAAEMLADDLSDRDRWCVFAPRCPHRTDDCTAPVALTGRPGGSQVRCVHSVVSDD